MSIDYIFMFKLDWESIRSSPRDGFRDGWVGVLGGVVGIFIMVHQARLMMFSLKLVDYSMFFLSLST